MSRQARINQAREEAAADAVRTFRERDGVNTDKIVKKKGILAQVRDHIAMAKKDRMRTVNQYLCDHCDAVILDEKKGFVIHGNIYTASVEQKGGLIGDNFPPCKDGEKIDPGSVQKTVLCLTCFVKVLGLNLVLDRSGSEVKQSSVRKELESILKRGG